ncbi:AraC family transcriptional regulator [Burkholderia multivorans]|uniref:AraC family transcriptional regulator n=1 Tax=Burkholderia multivorans TaxID=87883 RepID=UPI001C25E484|nr:AraC family transcriptional regulator [Burkholderia multivorans]MBU9598407.1 AraC family transcriptional regulator [Burkholderia multivorans]
MLDFDVVCNDRTDYSNGPHAHADDMLFVPIDGLFSVFSDTQNRTDVLASGSLWLVPGRSVHQVMASRGQRHLCYYLNVGGLLQSGTSYDGAAFQEPRKWGMSSFLIDLVRLRGHLSRQTFVAAGLKAHEVDRLILREVGRIIASVPPTLRDDKSTVIRELKLFISSHLDGDLSCATLARQFRTSTRTLARWFRSEQGQPVAQYVQQMRLAEAQRLLATSSLSVLEIQEATGFSSASHFAYAIRKAFGASPRHLRRRAQSWQGIDMSGSPATHEAGRDL